MENNDGVKTSKKVFDFVIGFLGLYAILFLWWFVYSEIFTVLYKLSSLSYIIGFFEIFAPFLIVGSIVLYFIWINKSKKIYIRKGAVVALDCFGIDSGFSVWRVPIGIRRCVFERLSPLILCQQNKKFKKQ